MDLFLEFIYVCIIIFYHKKILVCLPFLDTLVKRKADGSLDISVYCKDTHTDRYLDFYSCHPNHVKNGLVKSLFKRAHSIVASNSDILSEVEHLKDTLRHNGYPNKVILSTANSTEMPIIREEDNEKPDATIVIPYVAGLGEAIRRTCNKFNIIVAFRSNTLKFTPMKVLPTKQQSNVVYQVPKKTN